MASARVGTTSPLHRISFLLDTIREAAIADTPAFAELFDLHRSSMNNRAIFNHKNIRPIWSLPWLSKLGRIRARATAFILFIAAVCPACSRAPTASQSEPQEAQARSDTNSSSGSDQDAWSPNSVWQFDLFDDDDYVYKTATFRITDEPAKSCLSGDWKRLIAVSDTAEFAYRPAYLVEGRKLTILIWTDICDLYDKIEGELSGSSFIGKLASDGVFGAYDLGKVVGRAEK